MKIGILLGDDIGLEVVPECVKVMKAAAGRSGLAIDWHPLPIGKAGHEEHGNTLPAVTFFFLRVRASSNASRATRLEPLRVITLMPIVMSSLGRNSGRPATTVSE